MVDCDGNTVLDMNASAAGQILGYNHDDMINARKTEQYDRFVTHKVDANALPPSDLADILREHVMPYAPPGMPQVHLGGGASANGANELALSVAIRHFAKDHGLESAHKVCALGFDNSQHGETVLL